MAEVHEISDGVYRISSWLPQANLAFNQFLIKGALLVLAVVVDKLYQGRVTRLVSRTA